MGKAIVRLSIIIVAIYMIVSYSAAQLFGVDILRYTYTLLFELCVVVYSFSEGKYHCKFIKWTMLGIFLSDCVSHLDYYFEFIPLEIYNYFLGFLLFCSFAFSTILSIRHFYNVRKLKREYNELRQ